MGSNWRCYGVTYRLADGDAMGVIQPPQQLVIITMLDLTTSMQQM